MVFDERIIAITHLGADRYRESASVYEWFPFTLLYNARSALLPKGVRRAGHTEP